MAPKKMDKPSGSGGYSPEESPTVAEEQNTNSDATIAQVLEMLEQVDISETNMDGVASLEEAVKGIKKEVKDKDNDKRSPEEKEADRKSTPEGSYWEQKAGGCRFPLGIPRFHSDA